MFPYWWFCIIKLIIKYVVLGENKSVRGLEGELNKPYPKFFFKNVFTQNPKFSQD